MALGLSLMGITYAPVGTLISELFPTPVRYTGSSLAFSIAGILGASLAPSIATWLARTYGINSVGYYLSASAVVTLLGLLTIRETKDRDLTG
jgi:MFS family permease